MVYFFSADEAIVNASRMHWWAKAFQCPLQDHTHASSNDSVMFVGLMLIYISLMAFFTCYKNEVKIATREEK